MHTRRLFALVVVLTVAVGLASAHGWSVAVDDQVVGDDTVVASHVSMLESGYLAIHVVEDGAPGPVVGYRRFSDRGEFDHVEVALDGAAWADVDPPVELVAVVHTADSDLQFEWPGDDAIYRPDDPVVDRFTVDRTGEASARVLAVRQETDGNVTLRRVDMPTPGFVVLYEDADGERGEVVGVRHLAAGHHENVSVGVAPRYYNDADGRLYLIAGVHADDGDGVWEPNADGAVRAGDAPVTSAFDADKTVRSLPTPTPTATPEPTPTPEPTESPTPDPTATPGASPTTTPTASPSPEATTSPGFGLLAVLVALAVALLGLARRRAPLTRR